jgi:excisionase family DNA binding protein
MPRLTDPSARSVDAPGRPVSLLVSVQHGAQILGLPASTVRCLVHRGHLSFVRPAGSRRIWLPRADVLAFADHYAERQT